MVFNPQTKVNGFQEAYNLLSDKDKGRLKTSVLTICEITEVTFYNWLKNPELISKGHRFHIANLFNKDAAEMFNPKNS